MVGVRVQVWGKGAEWREGVRVQRAKDEDAGCRN